MSDCIYYTASVTLYGLSVFGACVIPDVDVIFEFVASISVNCLAFIFPSVFYLMAKKKYGSQYDEVSTFLVICSYLQFLLGIVAFVAGMTNNIYGIVNGSDSDNTEDE